MDLAAWYEELKRRRVFRAVVGYGIVCFAILQVVEPVLHALHLPDSVLSVAVLALAAGFPVVVALAWAFDLRGGRLQRAAPLAGPAPPSPLSLAVLLVGFGAVAAAPGVFYFFVYPGVGRERPATASATAGQGSLLAATIAVLPFVDMSPQHDQEYFSDGIAEEILGALAHVDGLRVIGRTSSFAFKGKSEDVATIAQKLKAGALLEGSVRREGDRVRVTAQLVSAADGVEVWSERYDRQLTGVFAVQDEIARAVVAALKGRLAPAAAPAAPISPATAAAPAPRPTTSPEAYAAYLLGRHFIALGTRDAMGQAVASLEKCVALDPGYAPGWASLAYAAFWYVQFESTAADQATFTARARDAAEKAVALAPGLADGYAMRGFLRLSQAWDWRDAEADFERAKALGLSDVTMLRLHARFVVAPQGRLGEGIASLRRAVELDPLSAPAWANLGTLLMYQGQHPESAAAFQRSLELAPGNPIAQILASYNLALQGRGEEALAAARQAQEPGWRTLGEAIAFSKLGHRAEADRALEELERKEGGTMAFQVASLRATRGEVGPALAWLERALRQEDGGLSDILVEPAFRNLRGEPRYRALLEKMHLPPDAVVR